MSIKTKQILQGMMMAAVFWLCVGAVFIGASYFGAIVFDDSPCLHPLQITDHISNSGENKLYYDGKTTVMVNDQLGTHTELRICR